MIGKVIKKIKKDVKTAVYLVPAVISALAPLYLRSKPLDLANTQENVAMKYLKGIELKVNKGGYNTYWGLISDLGNEYHFNIGAKAANDNPSWSAAILGKRLGIEAEGDFNKNTSMTLDYLVGGQVGLGITGKYDGNNVDVSGSIFRAEQIGGLMAYLKADVSKDKATSNFIFFYIPSAKIGDTKIIPAVMGSKSLTSGDYSFTTGAIVSSGKFGAGITAGTSDFKDWTPSVKLKYKF